MEGTIDSVQSHTLDEPVLTTLGRDLKSVWCKLKIVLLPRTSFSSSQQGENTIGYSWRDTYSSENANNQETLRMLRDWDLWGPLLVCLLLSTLLSLTSSTGSETNSSTFSTVFLLVWIGSLVVTVNAQLLGGTISLFQSLSVMGYSVFPLAVSKMLIMVVKIWANLKVLNFAFVAIGFVWSTKASVVFIGQFIGEGKRWVLSMNTEGPGIYHLHLYLSMLRCTAQLEAAGRQPDKLPISNTAQHEHCRGLAVFPVFFFYAILSWMILV